METITEVVFNAHREEAFITCPNNCWCWDFEAKLNIKKDVKNQ